MTDSDHHEANLDEPAVYEIRVGGYLDDRWREWFNGMSLSANSNGETLVTCQVVDQAALHGLLRKVRDLGLPLVSVRCLTCPEADANDLSNNISPLSGAE